jgi:hypothetical protein
VAAAGQAGDRRETHISEETVEKHLSQVFA